MSSVTTSYGLSTSLSTFLSSSTTIEVSRGSSTTIVSVGTYTSTISTWTPDTITFPISTSSSSASSSSSSSSSTVASSSTTTASSVSSTASTNTRTSTSNSSAKSQTSSTSRISPTVTHAAASKGVSSGTAVGVGVGAAFAGAFIALFVIWIFLRRSARSRRRGENSLLADGDHMGNSGGPKDNSVGKGVPKSIIALEDIPLDPADDSQIRKSMQDLNELIHQHVENHYSERTFQGQREDLRSELIKCGWSEWAEPSAHTIASLLINPVTRHVAIRHVIAWVIVQHIDLKSNPEISLLPTHILASSQAMLRIKRMPREQEVFLNSFTKWRHFTASLLSPLSSRPDNPESDSNLRPAVIRNVNLLNSILQPFIKLGTEAQIAQSDNLASIILEGAHFGMVLFSQPARWVFGWDGKNVSRQGGRSGRRSGAVNGSADKTIVVFPSIGKVVARDGSEALRVVEDATLERV